MSLNKQIKVICFDYDGTLVPFYEPMKQDTKETLMKLYQNGYVLALVSGRISSGAFKAISKAVDPNIIKYIYGLNGVDEYDNITKNHKFTRFFDLSKIKELYELFKDVDYASFGFYKGDILAIDKICDKDLVDFVSKTNNLEIQLYDFKNNNYCSPKMYCFHKIEDKDKVDNFVNEHKNKFDGVQIFRSISHCLEFMPIGVGKDLAIESICKKERVSKDEIMAFGDANNDKTMLESCIGVCMKNGQDEAKKSAKYICDDVNEGGITTFLKENGFIS